MAQARLERDGRMQSHRKVGVIPGCVSDAKSRSPKILDIWIDD